MMKAIVILGWDLEKEFPEVIGDYQVLHRLFCEDAYFPEYDVQLYVFSVVAPYSRRISPAEWGKAPEKTVFNFLREVRESNTMSELWCCTAHDITLSDWHWEPAVNAIVHPKNLLSELEDWAARSMP